MSRFDNQLLIIPEKADIERDAVATVWQENGGEVLRLGRFWEPPPLKCSQVRLYGNDTFCLVLAQQLNLCLVSPPDDLLMHINDKWLKRHLQLKRLCQTNMLNFPLFVKPLIPKQFRANIYSNHHELQDECNGLENDTLIVVSEVVNFTAEARTFILDDQVKSCAVYEGVANIRQAHDFARGFAKANKLPKTCVIDIGYLENRGWAVIEANATWGAGLNQCQPLQVAECIAHATLNS